MSAAEIAKALGGHRAGGQFLVRCPCHRDASPSLAVRDGAKGLLLYCHAGCDFRDVADSLRRLGFQVGAEPFEPDLRRRPPPRPGRYYRENYRDLAPKRDDDAERAAYVAKVWSQAKNPRGTLAEIYLRARGLALPDDLVGRVLRFHRACPWEKTTVPALLAAFRPIEGAAGVDEDAPPPALLRVGLTSEGAKIGKKMLGRVAGCAIMLDPDEDVERGLGITEGLEDALDVRQRGWRPMWALGSAGAVKAVPVLAGIEALTIFADSDPVGLAAASVCARRWRDAGREVEILPPDAVKDWNGAAR
jgi:hypothetical protein